MGNTEYVDKLVAEGFFDDVERLKKELPLLVNSMEQLSKAGRDVNAALGSRQTFKDVIENTSKAADVNTRIKTTVDVLGQSYKAASEVIAQHNGHSREYITVSKGIADTTLKEAKAATENAKRKTEEAKATTEVTKQKEIETRYTIALTREKEKLDKATQKEEAKLKILQSEYGKLNDAYKKAAEVAQNLGAKQFRLQSEVAAGNNVQVNNTELARLGPQLADAQANALRLHTALLSVDQAVGKSQRNVGNYNSATMAMTQILREAPAFAYSFSTGLMAISNNFPILLDELKRMKQANIAAAESGGEVKTTWDSLKESVFSVTGILTIATAALTIFAARWDGTTESMSDAEKAAAAFTERLLELNNAAADTYANETLKSNDLFDSITNLGLSYEARVSAIEKLMQLYPGLLSNLDQEALLNGKIAEKQEIVSQIISKRAFIKYYEDLAASIAKSRKELQKTFDKNNGTDMGGFYNPLSSKGTDEDIKNQQEQIKKLNDEITDAKYNADILKRELQFLLNPKDTHKGRILVDIDAEIKKQESIRDTTTVEDKAHKAAIKRLKELDEERARYLGREKERKEKEFQIDYDNIFNQKQYVVLAQTRDQYEAEQEAIYQRKMSAITLTERAMQDEKTNALNELKLLYENGSITYEEHTKKKEELDKHYVKASLMMHLAYYKILENEYPDEERLKKLISDTEAALANIGVNKPAAKSDKNLFGMSPKEWSEAKAIFAQVLQLEEQVQKAVNAKHQREIEHLERKKQLIDENYNADVAAINGSFASEQKKSIQIAQLAAQKAAQDKAINEEIRREKRKMAQNDKIAAISTAIAQGAVAVVEALPNYILAGLVALTAAAQVAAISSTQVPQYGKGTEDHPGGPAIIGDKPEWVIEPGKAPYFTSSTHMRNLARHTRVVPQEKLIAGSMGFLTPELLQQINVGGGDNSGIERKLQENADRITAAINNKNENHFSWNNGELQKSVKKGSSWITYLDRNF